MKVDAEGVMDPQKEAKLVGARSDSSSMYAMLGEKL
jgi:hypothetical protein